MANITRSSRLSPAVEDAQSVRSATAILESSAPPIAMTTSRSTSSPPALARATFTAYSTTRPRAGSSVPAPSDANGYQCKHIAPLQLSFGWISTDPTGPDDHPGPLATAMASVPDLEQRIEKLERNVIDFTIWPPDCVSSPELRAGTRDFSRPFSQVSAPLTADNWTTSFWILGRRRARCVQLCHQSSNVSNIHTLL